MVINSIIGFNFNEFENSIFDRVLKIVCGFECIISILIDFIKVN